MDRNQTGQRGDVAHTSGQHTVNITTAFLKAAAPVHKATEQRVCKTQLRHIQMTSFTLRQFIRSLSFAKISFKLRRQASVSKQHVNSMQIHLFPNCAWSK